MNRNLCGLKKVIKQVLQLDSFKDQVAEEGRKRNPVSAARAGRWSESNQAWSLMICICLTLGMRRIREVSRCLTA